MILKIEKLVHKGRLIAGKSSFCCLQAESAIIKAESSNIEILGSVKATTCFIAIARDCETIGIIHIDRYEETFLTEFFSNFGINVELWIIGGLLSNSSRNLFNNFHNLILKLNQKFSLHTQILEENTTLDQKPVLTSLAYKNYEVYSPVIFKEIEPMLELRMLRPMIPNSKLIVLVENDKMVIPVFSYKDEFYPMSIYLLNHSEEDILQLFSTSPDSEEPDFVGNLKKCALFVLNNDDVFVVGKPLVFYFGPDGWEKEC